MKFDQILTEVNEIFKKVFKNPDIQITAETSAADIDAWDSLSHIKLIVAIEKHFKITFTTTELQSRKNIGELISIVEGKLNK